MSFYRILSIVLALALGLVAPLRATQFDLSTATIADINAAFDAGALTSEKLVQLYLNRIEAYDQKGPKLNVIIARNPRALEEARAFKALLDLPEAKHTPATLAAKVSKAEAYVVNRVRLTELIEPEFEPQSWRAFASTVLQGRPTAEVARELGMKVNTVLQAKSRILRRLRQEREQFQD